MKAGFILNGVFVNDPRVLNEARILAGNGYQVYVLNLPPDKNVPRFVQFEDNIFLVHRRIPKKANNVLFALENTFALFDYSWNISIKRFIKKYGIEILHAHDLYMARAAKRASDHYKIPLVLDLHENYPAAIKEYHWANRFPSRLIVRPSRWEKKEKKYLSYADRIIVLSSSYRNHLLAKYPGTDPVQVKIYPNVPDVKRMSSYAIDRDILPPYDRKIIFYFGVISQRRGIMTTIEAAEILLRDNQSIHLLLIGPID
ncbi:MAG TPA: glycosyltransferase, partial [Bacteroidales bacterium]|nr:glycosyltransferase [Bacteroidales bacterium]